MLKKRLEDMNEKQLLVELNKKVEMLSLSVSLAGKNFEDQVKILTDMGYGQSIISKIIGKKEKDVENLLYRLKKNVKGVKENVQKI